ncbi:MAG: tyrosine-type recombinase/integrase [candidate division Zixibacteria bacterium]|nr:tyrosine-type recombinase/integrase [candidate division Zixibacteria bacterium]
MGTIYKREKTWYIDVRAGGKRIRKRVGSSKKVAELALKDAEVKIARDEFGFAQNDIQIQKFLDKFFEYSEANHSAATFKRYRAVIDHFNRYLKLKPEVILLSQVKAKEIDEYKVFRKGEWVNPNGDPIESDEKITEHTRKGARAHTINFEVGTLRTIFNMAIKWGYLKDNPAKGIIKLKVNDSKKPRFLTKEECRLLLDNSPDDLKAIYYVFLNTGMRKAELENLEWSDIDFRRKKIRIQRKEFWNPKTGEREIPMNQGTYNLLKKLREQNSKGLKSSFVFPSEDGSKIKEKLRRQLIRIAQKAKIEGLTKLHSLRHTYASHLVMSGVDLPTVQKLMAHSDI